MCLGLVLFSGVMKKVREIVKGSFKDCTVSQSRFLTALKTVTHSHHPSVPS